MHQEFQFPLWYTVHLGTESEHQVLNGSHIFVPFMQVLLLFGTKFQYLCTRTQDKEGKQYDKAAIRDLVLTFRLTLHSIQQRKLKLLMPVCIIIKSLTHGCHAWIKIYYSWQCKDLFKVDSHLLSYVKTMFNLKNVRTSCPTTVKFLLNMSKFSLDVHWPTVICSPSYNNHVPF